MKIPLFLVLCLVKNSQAQDCGHCEVAGRFCYAFNTNRVINNVAISQCANTKGRLPFFAIMQDQNDFSAYCVSKGLGDLWLGYWSAGPHSVASPGDWVDQQGNLAPFLNFDPAQPNNYGGNQDCVYAFPGGKWNDFACSDLYQVVCQCECGLPLGVPNLNVAGGVPPAVNSVITLTCDSCYQISGPTSATCYYNGTTVVWDQPVNTTQCTRRTCTSIFNTLTGTPPTGPFLACVNYTYTCKTNYIVESINAIQKTYECQENGTWNIPFEPCKITCPDLPNVGKIYVSGGTSANVLNRPIEGTVATFACALGWTLQGPANSTCNSTAQWSDPYPFCNRTGAVCDSIFDETTGTISNATGPYLLGTRYNFTCNTNLLMWPENTQLTIYTCQYDVTWDQPFKACSQTCSPINSLTGGIVNQITIPNLLGRPVEGTNVNFTCNSGYVLNGSNMVTCGTDGQWSSAMPTCERSICPDIFSASNTGTTSITTYLSNTVYTYTCKPNYYTVSKNGLSKDYICLSNGSWNQPFEPCAPVCTSITTLSNGIATGGAQNTPVINGVSPGTEVIFNCHSGRTLLGAKTIKCLNNGSWSQNIPECSETRCPWIFDKTGEIDDNIFLPKQTYYFTCAINAVIKGSMDTGAAYYCDEQGNWSPNFVSCSYICNEITDFVNGVVEYTAIDSYIFEGAKATFTCNKGFQLKGVTEASCLANGTWSDKSTCDGRALCDDIWTGDAGNWSSDPPFYTMTTVVYTCPKNTVPTTNGIAKLFCTTEGKWSPNKPECLNTCKLGDLTVDNGRIEFPVKNQVVLEDRVMIGAQISISCDKDFIVSQPSSIICTQYGNWTAEFPYCYKENYNIWWWPLILGLMILAVTACGISLACWKQKTHNKQENSFLNQGFMRDHTYHA